MTGQSFIMFPLFTLYPLRLLSIISCTGCPQTFFDFLNPYSLKTLINYFLNPFFMGNILNTCYSSVKARVIIIGDPEQCKTLFSYFTGISAIPNEHYEHLIKKKKITLAFPYVASNMWKVHIQHADGVAFVGDLEGFNEFREIFEVCKCKLLFVNNGNKEVVIDDCNVMVTNAFGDVDKMVLGCEKLFTKLLK